VSRTFIFAPSNEPDRAAKAIAEAGVSPDLVLVAPSPAAGELAAAAVGGRYVLTIEEPLLAAVPGGSGEEALDRLAQAMRVVQAYDARAPVVLWDRVEIFGTSCFTLEEAGLDRLADDLERALPLP
jgi:hypothetical protein